MPIISNSSVSPSLYSACVYCFEPIIIRKILLTCPNLKRLQVKLGSINQNIDLPIIPLNHCLKRFILFDCYHLLSLQTIDKILLYIPNIKEFFFQGCCRSSFLHFGQILFNRLKYLIKFHCSILELSNNYENNNLETIQIHPCFYRIQYTINSHGYRLFTANGLNKDFFGS